LYGEDEDQWGMVLHEVPHARSNREKEGRTLTLIFGFVYHVMNITCIYEDRRPEYIHVHEGENIQRTPGEIQ
jgi:hypothetical protein